METKANYVLIGLFTLGGILGALGLLLWLAKVEVDRQYAYYDVLFDNVSGLGSASDVRYNGLPVGQVVGLALDDEDASQVRVRIEVNSDTPVNVDTVAQLQSQGVTGVSFVALSGGSETSAALPQDAVIPTERTALQSVFEGAPLVLERAVTLLENINDVFSTDNKAAVGTLVGNLATSSERLDSVLANFEDLSGDLGAAAREIATFTERLDQLSGTAETTLTAATGALQTADGTLDAIGSFTTTNLVPLSDDLRATSQSATRILDEAGIEITRLSGRIDQLADSGAMVLGNANTAIEGLSQFTQTELTPLAQDARAAAQTATRVIDDVGTQTERLVARIDTLADSGTATLDSATLTFNDAQTTLKSVDQLATTFEQFTTDQLTPLSDDLRTGTQTATRVIDDLGTRGATTLSGLDGLVGEGSNAIAIFNTTMGNADATMEWVNAAMTGATDTLVLASRTFASANSVIENDIGGIIADLRMAAANLGATFSSTSEDGIITDLRQAARTFTDSVELASRNIDDISGELLAATTSAASLTNTLDTVVSDNRRQISDFFRAGLPELLRFTEEARSLVGNLERLVSKVERDPGRFLLGTQSSEFSR